MAGTALVTGGRRGIGRGIALALAEAGFDVVVNDLVEDDKAAETLHMIRERGRRAAFVQADVGDLAGQDRLVEQAWSAFGQVGRAHVCNPVPNAHLVCRLPLDKKTNNVPLR